MKRSELRPLPPRVTPVICLGRALVGAAWVAYRPGGVLSYNEVAALVVVRRGVRLAVTTTDIWVDSVASARGGRELWGIPKQLASFEIIENGDFSGSATEAAGGRRIASLRFVPGAALPIFPTLPLLIAQELHGELKLTRMKIGGRARLGRAEWSFPAEGQLAFLPRRAPAFSLRIDDADLLFGS